MRMLADYVPQTIQLAIGDSPDDRTLLVDQAAAAELHRIAIEIAAR